MAKETTTLDIHMVALDILYEVEGIDPLALEDHLPATVATILYMLMDKKEED